ncbi:DUF5360 family protein [Actinophytocola sp.]|uniref:DUF5360 family protein n=1 Tax=Actinophytocola sp. TaxID=1872138 RepID=UPI002ED41B8D
MKRLMLATDLGLLAYWVVTATGLIPPYPEQVLVDWNWSFLTLDLLAAGTGLVALHLARRGHPEARSAVLISLALTHAAGLVALSFWVLRGEYDLAWWLPNLWLAGFPIVAVGVLFGCPVETVGGRR